MLTNRSHSPLYLPLLIAVCGILFSVWNALDAASVPCVSAGCTLYQNFSINGSSLWWGGVGIFSLLGLLALTGRAVLGRWLAGLAVLLDCVLLGIMILTLPCVDVYKRQMHERFGFTFAGKSVKAGYKFGRWLDLVFYQKLLDGPKQPVGE